VLIHKITKDRHAGEYQLYIKKILGFSGIGTSGGRNPNRTSYKTGWSPLTSVEGHADSE
jgi:hypothetical protein